MLLKHKISEKFSANYLFLRGTSINTDRFYIVTLQLQERSQSLYWECAAYWNDCRKWTYGNDDKLILSCSPHCQQHRHPIVKGFLWILLWLTSHILYTYYTCLSKLSVCKYMQSEHHVKCIYNGNNLRIKWYFISPSMWRLDHRAALWSIWRCSCQ